MIRIIFAAALASAITSADAANITVDLYWFGGVRILYRGEVTAGDDQRFEAIASSIPQDATVAVHLASPGGVVGPALMIGREIRRRGWMTVVWSSGGCASACTLMWSAGNPAVIEAGSRLGWHAPVEWDGRYSSEGAREVARYLREIGLTDAQIEYALEVPQPHIHWSTITDALWLLELPLPWPSVFGLWRLCPGRICVTLP